MCGIAGFCDFSKKSTNDMLKDMTDVLHHRGPDDSGYLWDENEYSQIALGHRRLSVLDLSTHGHQPMSFEHLNIVFNGEVYNFKEIRKELLELGYIFHSNSDTEVILKSYHQWGIKAVDKFNGMFAITIHDKKANNFIFIRDRAGVKPFYYYKKDSLILFSSELKSFHKHPNFQKEINKSSLSLYLQFGYIPEPHSIFKDCYKLRAGHYIKLDLKSQKFEEIKYWDVVDFYIKPKLDISQDEAIEKTEGLLKSSFEYRMVSDVPVGVFLSGGYDSSVVTAMLQSGRSEKLNTFTIGFKEKGFDEAPYAKEVAKYLGTNHTEYYCTQKDALKIIPKLCEIYDEPFGDDSAIPTVLVSKLAKNDVSVSLSADGGDEIFAGYEKYSTTLNYTSKFNKINKGLQRTVAYAMDHFNPKNIPIVNSTYNFETKYFKLNNILKSDSNIEIFKNISECFTKQERKKLFKSDIFDLKTNFDILNSRLQDEDLLNSIMAIDYSTYMNDCILTKVDRATMSVSLEGREPLLDYRLIEFVSQLPSNLKYKDGDKKWLLKQITHKYLPKKMMDRPKKGFGVPLTEWFRDELKEYLIVYLNDKRIDKEGLFHSTEVTKLKDNYLNGNKQNVQKLWLLLMFEMWYEKWM